MSKDINVKKRNGRLEHFNPDKINKCVERACEGLDKVSASEVVLDAQITFNDKIKTSEIDSNLILTARSKIYKNPQYSKVAARLLLNCLYKEVFKESVDCDTFEEDYRSAFIKNIKKGVKDGSYSEKMLDYDLKELATYIKPERDLLYKYVGVQNLYDRYLLKSDDKIIETPQHFHMRVAMGLCYDEKENKEEFVRELYDAYSQHFCSPSTPTLFNSGTPNNQLSSCYLSEIDDSVNGIFDGLWQEARKSKHAGGLGFHMSKIRGMNAKVRGTNGRSTGLIPWLKVYNDMLIACNQGGKRKGSGCAYIEPWHIDIDDFLDIRKNNGEERRRCHDLNTALWIPDLFMERVEAEGKWTLFCPDDAKGLADSYGDDFAKLYKKYEKAAENGEIKNFKTIEAKSLWKKVLKVLFETSHPWPTFKDNANFRYSNIHKGIIHGSNLCTEIFLHTIASKYGDNDQFGEKIEAGETAVCNLASVCLANHMTKDDKGNWKIDYDLLKKTIKTVVRGLDNVIDINFYPTREAYNANSRHRPIGMGCMGWADVYVKLGIAQDSDAATELSDELMEFISYHAIMTSSELAKERGRYSSFEGSLWDQDILPIDSYDKLMDWKKDGVKVGGKGKLDWQPVRDHIKEHGMRNSNTMAIAPNASIAYLLGCEQSIEPFFSMLFRYENMSGNIFIINEHFVDAMEKEGIWCDDFAEAVAEADGNVTVLNIPDKYKELFKPAKERDQFKLIEVNAARQKWIDQGISFNLYTGGAASMTQSGSPSMAFLNNIYMHANKYGLKSTYYLRNVAASKVQKVAGKRTEVQKPEFNIAELQEKLMDGKELTEEEYAYYNEKAAACSIEAAANGEACEMCQG